MLYTRREIVELCNGAPELKPLLVSLIWHLSRGDPNCQDNQGRHGLLQIPITIARAYGIKSESELLEPKTNIAIAIRLLRDRGLIEFLGREFAPQYHSILGLERYLNDAERESRKTDAVVKTPQSG